ncbi:MAG: hydratase, partial [Clostridia bacterium]|nr:hydratase [Clostridia bacterium]
MIDLYEQGVYLVDGKPVKEPVAGVTPEQGRENTIAYQILRAHNTSEEAKKMKIRFDCLMSHDITYVGIIQTARASG